jgi:simple sugar transport system permease protein
MNTSTTKKPRQESDRQGEKKWYSALMARPEVGPLGVMILLFVCWDTFQFQKDNFL